MKIFQVFLLITFVFLFAGCEAINKKSDEIVKKENEKLSKFIGQPAAELKIVMGNPDDEVKDNKGAKLLIYKYKISMLSSYLVIVGIIAILLGKRFYGHYFLFLVPAWLNILIDLNKSYQINYYIKSGLKILIGFSLAVQIYAIQLQFFALFF